MNNVKPLVTIVTLTYKKFDKLFETINSVFEQDYPNIEYIIADDGSENFPKAKIDDFINEKEEAFYIKILHSDENRGTVKNLNTACKQSVGEYILFLSCGDVFFSKDVVSKIVERFLETKANVIVATRLLYKDDYEPICFLPHYCERKIIEKNKTNMQQYEMFVAGHYYDMASGSAMYFSRAILEEFNYFDERYVLWEDGPFLAKYLAKYPLTFSYDITSIWYEIGGVSTGEIKNSLLSKDVEFFNATERLEHIKELKPSGRKLLKYLMDGYGNKSFLKKMKLRISNPVQFLFFQKLRIQRNIFKLYDKKLLKNCSIIKNRNLKND